MAAVGPKPPSDEEKPAIRYETPLTDEAVRVAQAAIPAIHASVSWTRYDATIRGALSYEPESFIIAKEEGRTIGYILSQNRGRTWTVEYIAVTAEKATRGVGSELMLRTMKKAKKAGALVVVAHFRGNKPNLQKFYGSLGDKARARHLVISTTIEDTGTTYQNDDPRHEVRYTIDPSEEPPPEEGKASK